jgi:hypothetical protein
MTEAHALTLQAAETILTPSVHELLDALTTAADRHVTVDPPDRGRTEAL